MYQICGIESRHQQPDDGNYPYSIAHWLFTKYSSFRYVLPVPYGFIFLFVLACNHPFSSFMVAQRDEKWQEMLNASV